MSLTKSILSASLLLLLTLASACGGGGGGSTPPAPTTYTVTFVAGTGGTLTGTATQTVTSGGSTTAVTAVPNANYTFTSWTGSGFTTSTATTLTVTNVNANLTITANFAALPTYTVTFAAGTGGTLTGTTSQSVISGSSATPVTAVPSAGYMFVNWTGTGFSTSTTNPLTVTNVPSNLTITANFATLPTYTVTFVAGTGGTLTGSASQSVISGGSTSAVTAVASTGYTFGTWTGSGFNTSTTNPLTVANVTANLTLTANFNVLPAATLAYTDPTTGTFQLKKNTTLSTTTHLVLDLVGPAATTGSGISAAFTVDTTKVSWANVAAADAAGTYVQTGGAFTLGTGTQILKGKVTAGVLQVTAAQKGTASPVALNTPLVRVALDLKASQAPGAITLSANAGKAYYTDASGNITATTVIVGTIAAQ